MDAAGLEDLAPGGITNLAGLLLIPIAIAEVGRAGGAIFTSFENIGSRLGSGVGEAVNNFGFGGHDVVFPVG